MPEGEHPPVPNPQEPPEAAKAYIQRLFDDWVRSQAEAQGQIVGAIKILAERVEQLRTGQGLTQPVAVAAQPTSGQSQPVQQLTTTAAVDGKPKTADLLLAGLAQVLPQVMPALINKFMAPAPVPFNPANVSLGQIEALWNARPDECYFVAQKHIPDAVMDIWPQESARIYHAAWTAGQLALRTAWKSMGRDPAELPVVETPALPAPRRTVVQPAATAPAATPTSTLTESRPEPQPSTTGQPAAAASLRSGPGPASPSRRSKFAIGGTV